MGFVSERVFTRNVSALSEAILETADTFAEQRAIAPLDRSALRQLTTPVTEVASEILRFGHDVWPPSAAEGIEPQSILMDRVEPVAARKRFAGLMPAALTALVLGGGTVAAGNILDHDNDGRISLSDLHATLDKIAYGDATNVPRHVVIHGIPKDVIVSWTVPNGYEVTEVKEPIVARLEKRPKDPEYKTEKAKTDAQVD